MGDYDTCRWAATLGRAYCRHPLKGDGPLAAVIKPRTDCRRCSNYEKEGRDRDKARAETIPRD